MYATILILAACGTTPSDAWEEGFQAAMDEVKAELSDNRARIEHLETRLATAEATAATHDGHLADLDGKHDAQEDHLADLDALAAENVDDADLASALLPYAQLTELTDYALVTDLDAYTPLAEHQALGDAAVRWIDTTSAVAGVVTLDVGDEETLADVQDAFQSLRNRRIPDDIVVRIDIADGTYVHIEPLVLHHPDGDRIQIVGNPTDPLAVTLTFPGVDGVVVDDGHVVGLLDGVRLLGDGTVSGTTAWGIRVEHGSVLHLGTVHVSGFAQYGVVAQDNSVISSFEGGLTVTGNGGTGLYAGYGAYILASGAYITDNERGAHATAGGILHLEEALVLGNRHNGVEGSLGATIYAPHLEVESSAQYGVFASVGSAVDTRFGHSTGNTYGGYFASYGSVVWADSTDASGNDGGYRAVWGSAVGARRSTSTQDGEYDYAATHFSVVDSRDHDGEHVALEDIFGNVY